MLIIFLRTILLYCTIILALRIMGKKQIGELQPSELVITIMISELASIPMQDLSVPLIHGILPILTLLVLEVILTFISLKNRWLRNVISGTPSILIENGVINEIEMRKLRFNIDDLFEELRLTNNVNIKDIQYAILETSGQISIIPKPEKKPLTREDMNIKNNDSYPIILISDGEIDLINLDRSNKNIKWLTNELKKRKLEVKNIFLAYIDNKGNFIYQVKNKVKEKKEK
jgi:uncharacterized membrane protein YcaP (DUF421 family)